MLCSFLVLVSAVIVAFASTEISQNKFLYGPKDLGIYNLTSCTGAPSCGATMTSYNGVAAKSNGVDQCTGICSTV
jgi:hypothetical protein